jgi:ankyrin repeat protein
MPFGGALAAEQIKLIRDWIDQGAEWPDSLAGEAPPHVTDPKAARIMEALRLRDSAAFDRLIRNRIAINRLGTNADTPLMYSVFYGSIDSVRKLLDAGAEANLANSVGATALMWAVRDIEKVQTLVEHGAKVDVVSNDGRTPLETAIQRSDGEATALFLLNHGAKFAAGWGRSR